MLPAALTVALVSSACSSTPSTNKTAAKGPGVIAGVDSGSTTTVAGAAAAGAASAGGAKRAATGAVAKTSGGAAAASNPAAPGDRSTLLIGAFTLQFSNTAGATGVALGDQNLENNALAKYINAHGGLAGHPVKVLIATEDPTSGVPLEQQEQAGCVKFTEDNHVFAVVTATTTTATFFNCLAKHHTPVFMATTYVPDQNALNTDLMYSVSPSMDRTGATMADALQHMGFFTGAKLGIVYANSGYYLSGAAAFKQAAAKYGVKPTDEAALCGSCATQEQANDANSAVVRFRSKGVDHVVLLDGVSFSAYLQAEQAQSFYPRIALNSNAVPEAIALNTSPAAFTDAVGIGWTPAADMDNAHDGPENNTPARQVCEKTIRDAGQDLTTSPLAEVNALYNCDIYFLMKAVVDKAGRADVSALRGAAESLGESYAPAITWASYYGPNRHDGTQFWRPFKFDVTCKCWIYTGGQQPFSKLPGQVK